VPEDFEQMTASMKKATAALRDADVPHALGGGFALWAHGASPSVHDIDFLVKRSDAERAARALADAGMRIEKPPEDWLLKAFDGDVMIDVIFEPTSGPITDDLLRRARELEVMAMGVPVARLEDIFVQKLMALTEHEPDYSGVLAPARAVREQIDWDEVRERTESSPFARGFFAITEGLEIVPQ
jgi:Uncharacterised nucleotidyltransferase